MLKALFSGLISGLAAYLFCLPISLCGIRTGDWCRYVGSMLKKEFCPEQGRFRGQYQIDFGPFCKTVQLELENEPADTEMFYCLRGVPFAIYSENGGMINCFGEFIRTWAVVYIALRLILEICL